MRSIMNLSESNLSKFINITQKTLYIVLSILILLVIWECVALIVDNEYLLPTVSQAFVDLWGQLQSKVFYQSFLYTILRTLVSFLIAIVLALLLFLLSKASKFTQTFVNFFVSVLRSIPTIAIILFLLLWTNSQVAPSIICILVITPIIFASLQTINVDASTKNMCQIFDIKGYKYFYFVLLPKIQSNLMPTLSSSIALNLKVMVASEVLASTYLSLGGLMQNASVYFDMGNLMAIAFVTIITAIVLQKLLSMTKYIKIKVKNK